jgi:uncharacterized protein YndB with AHSA1/START domain
MTNKKPVFTKDTENKKLTVVRQFDAILQEVWDAWTTAEILDQWWAPKPYKAETKSMDFRAGGVWMYCMAGPEGDRQWCRVEYYTIDPNRSISSAAMFCDEAGVINEEFPKMYWKQDFTQTGDTTTVTVEVSFDKSADMEMILKMGFQEGFTAGLENLDDYLAGK